MPSYTQLKPTADWITNHVAQVAPRHCSLFITCAACSYSLPVCHAYRQASRKFVVRLSGLQYTKFTGTLSNASPVCACIHHPIAIALVYEAVKPVNEAVHSDSASGAAVHLPCVGW